MSTGFAAALRFNRSFYMRPDDWRWGNWNKLFLPVSPCASPPVDCRQGKGDGQVNNEIPYSRRCITGIGRKHQRTWLNYPMITDWLRLLPEYQLAKADGESQTPPVKVRVWDWWHTVAFAYIFRGLQPPVANAYNKYREQIFGVPGSTVTPTPVSPVAAGVSTGVSKLPAPQQQMAGSVVPHHTVSLHVRHGDKGSQMKLFDLAAYMQQANEMRGSNSDIDRQATIFISTEDQTVIDDARTPAYLANWTMKWMDIPRNNRVPGDHMTIYANLFIASDCNFGVCTPKSSWCQLLRHLRGVVSWRTSNQGRTLGVDCDTDKSAVC
jgi:hypothetical protein